MENPRWVDINNGVLAENTRVLKVFLQTGNETKVFPFVVDKITDSRDNNFSVYRKIEASGLAFAELGKVGYKLELSQETLTIERELNKDYNILPTINYWLDKVFPNKKDENGNIIEWLSPWCYEIRMDWSHYTDELREQTKIYTDAYISSWGILESESEDTADKMVAEGIVLSEEKARFINCKNSNKYNITQDIAEAFEVFCVYEYKCAKNGQFIHSYQQDGKRWTGRKVVFYNRAIKGENPLIIDYEKNLQTITRTSDSSEIYTKLYVTPLQSEIMEGGYVTIANTPVNPLLDEFILNFDYLYNIGAINDYQKNFIQEYETALHNLNTALIELSPSISAKTVEQNELKAKVAAIEKEVNAAQNQLTKYQTLRDNEATNTPVIKNKDSSCTIIFVAEQDGTSRGQIRFEGVDANSIKAYKDSSYEKDKIIFTKASLKDVTKITLPEANDNSFYLIRDDYGFPKTIYTNASNPVLGASGGAVFYLELIYCPKNAYESICNQLESTIKYKKAQKGQVEKYIQNDEDETGIFYDLEKLKIEQDNLLKQKQEWNDRLELILGPSLREGYWNAGDGYEDPGQNVEIDLSIGLEAASKGASLFFDTKPFEGEDENFYYELTENSYEPQKQYYSYLDISEYYTKWHDDASSMNDLVIHLLNPNFVYTVVNNNLKAREYYIIYAGEKYYFILSEEQPVNTELEIKIQNGKPVLYINGAKYATLSTTILNNANNLTDSFMGLNNYLGDRLLYNNAGFVFTFLLKDTTPIPVLLFNDNSIAYERYSDIAYSFSDGEQILFTNSIVSNETSKYKMLYPRIAILESNVNYKAEGLTIVPYYKKEGWNEDIKGLEKYTDYMIHTRLGKPYITLKITSANDIYTILHGAYRTNYQISRANESLYLDAKQVAFENSQPKYSYEVSIANNPNENQSIELGQLAYINDHSLGVHAASGYVSEVSYDLSQAKNDTITVQNYKTKFEDLFSTITASSEAMRNNAASYNIAARGFTPGGQLTGTVLQNAIANNDIVLNFSETNVNIDDEDGIILTNYKAYTNGVYGQVKLQGGGIFLSNSVDAGGNRIWHTGITPDGINASLITTGQLDTNLIRIFSGANLAFQWNGEGIFAYRHNADGTTDLNSYVRYSEKGLQYIIGDTACVDLGWNGLFIGAQEGAIELTGDEGLIVYEGQKNSSGSNHVVRLGRFVDTTGQYDYGLRLYKKSESVSSYSSDDMAEYTETLVTTNNGELWLKDQILVGTATEEENGTVNAAGIAGDLNNNTWSDSVRFWAGSSSSNKTEAPFQVRQDGTLIASKGRIGSLTIEGIEDDIAQMTVSFSITSSIGDIFTQDNNITTITANLIKNGEIISDLSDYTFIWQEYNSDEWTPINAESISALEDLQVVNNQQIRCLAIDSKGRKLLSNTITFVELVVENADPVLYRIESSANQVMKALTSGYTPETITLYPYCGNELLQFDIPDAESEENIEVENYYPINNEGYKLEFYVVENNSKIPYTSNKFWFIKEDGEESTSIELYLNDEDFSVKACSTLEIRLLKNDELKAITSIDFVLDSRLMELAQVREGEVIIGQGKVIASSIVAGAITSNEIAAETILAKNLKAGILLAEHLQSNSLTSLEEVIFEDDKQLYTEQGSIINFSGQGSIHFRNFYIDNEGNLGIKGNGEIANWIMRPDYLAKMNETKDSYLVGLYSGTTITAGKDNSPVRFFAGGTQPSERKFLVTESGFLKATEADITGSITVEDGYVKQYFYVGEKNNGIVLDGTNGSLHSAIYSSSTSGWHIDKDGNSEFNNITARGKLTSVIFETNKRSAVAGLLYIAPSLAIDKNIIINDQLRFSVIVANIDRWPVNTEALFNGIIGKTEYTDLALIVESNNEVERKVVFKIKNNSTNIKVGEIIQSGANIVFIGNNKNKQYIALNAEDLNGPFIDVQDTATENNNILPQVRLGNLNGIIDIDYFGEKPLEGYGLYSQNAYLRGQLVLPKVGFTNQEEIGYGGNGFYEEASADTQVRIWAGGDKPTNGSQAAPFIVTQDGSLYATKGVFSGIVEAIDGYFNGTIRTAGVIIDDTKTEEKESFSDHFYVAYKTNPEYNDYVLNIDKKGLSVYEGGLQAYSDIASGWRDDIRSEYTYQPYNYNQKDNSNQNFSPFFYLKDDAIFDNKGEAINKITSRWISHSGHILNLIADSNQLHAYSIIMDDGISFAQGSYENDEPIDAIETKQYSRSGTKGFRMAINAANQEYLEVYSNDFIGFNINKDQKLSHPYTINGAVQLTDTKSAEGSKLLFEQQIVKEAYYNGVSCGIDIVTNYSPLNDLEQTIENDENILEGVN